MFYRISNIHVHVKYTTDSALSSHDFQLPEAVYCNWTGLTPMSQMEVGCPGARRLVPPTQTQVGRTPHKPALPATQP